MKGAPREVHEKEEAAALRQAAVALRASNKILQKVSLEKLDHMATEVLCAWIAARSFEGQTMPEVHKLIRSVPGRVPSMEPFIRQSLSDNIKHMDLPFGQSIGEWSAEDMVRMISASLAYSEAAKLAHDEGIPT